MLHSPDVDDPPDMPELYRTTTVDGYEPTEMNTWVGGDPNTVSRSSGPNGNCAPVACPSGPVGMVMIPLAMPVRMPQEEVASTFQELPHSRTVQDAIVGDFDSTNEYLNSGTNVQTPSDMGFYQGPTEDEYEPPEMWPPWGPGYLGNAGTRDVSDSCLPPQMSAFCRDMTGGEYEAAEVWPWEVREPNGMRGPVVLPGDAGASFSGTYSAVGMVPVRMPTSVQDPSVTHEVEARPVDGFAAWPHNLPGAPLTPAPDVEVRRAAAGSLAAVPARGGATAPPPKAQSPAAGPDCFDSRRAQTLEYEYHARSQVYRIWWTVDARKLKSSDREAVSPGFALGFPRPVQFKMVIRPSAVHGSRGGASFKKAKGKGSVELRCLEQVERGRDPPLNFRIAVGSGRNFGEAPRGPVRHDFSERATCGLPDNLKEWDFSRHVDHETQMLSICLEILGGVTGVQAARGT